MPQFTIIANTKPSVLYLAFHGNSSERLLAEFFTGDPEAKRVPCVQTATPKFKGRIHLLDALGETFYEPRKFFNDIPSNQHFILLPGRIDDEIQIFRYKAELSRIDNIPIEPSVKSVITSKLGNHYTVRTFKGDSRMKIGIKDKAQRVCRFCGKSLPDAKFGNKSHAISRSLGNIGLICLEECDDCNTRFNETIEQDICNLFLFQLMIKGINGRNGDRTIKGDKVSITNDTSTREIIGRDTITIHIDSTIDTRDPHKIAQILSKNMSFSRVKFRPQNVYKCFCKYVLSLLDSRHLPYFKDTIKWINEPLAKRKLPPIWHIAFPFGDVPSLAVMMRKHNQKEMPFCWAVTSIAGLQFLFIVPYCSQDKYKFVGKSRVKLFEDNLKKFMPNVNLTSFSFNGIDPVPIETEFNLEIPPDCVEGSDYFFVESDS